LCQHKNKLQNACQHYYEEQKQNLSNYAKAR
jgi:hypothetical protein